MRPIAKKMSRRTKLLCVLLLPTLLLAGGTGWLVTSNSGLHWLVAIVAQQSKGRFNAQGVNGSLFDTFSIQQLILHGEGWRITLQDVRLHWQPSAMLHGEVKVLQLSAQQIDVLSTPSSAPSKFPDNMSFPFALSVQQLNVNSLRRLSQSGAQPDILLSELEAGFLIDAQHFQLHRIRARLLQGEFEGLGEMAFKNPYPLKAQLTLASTVPYFKAQESAHLSAEFSGDLQRIKVKLDGNGAGMRFNGSAQLAPYTDTPISRFKLAFDGMDTGRLFNAIPLAVISGDIDLHGTAAGALEGTLQARNSQAAALNKNGLPLLGVRTQLKLTAEQLQLQQLHLLLPNNGQISGTVSWHRPNGKMNAQLEINNLDPAVLDTRLPASHSSAARFHGAVTLDSDGVEQHASVALSNERLSLLGQLKLQGKQLQLYDVRVAQGDSVLTGHGQLALDRRRTYRFSGQIQNLNLAEFSASPATDLNIGMEVSGSLLPEMHGTLLINLADSRYMQQDISAKGQIDFSGVGRAAGNIDLSLGENHLNLDVAYGTPSDRVLLILDAPNLAQFGNGLAGQLHATGDLSGSLEDPRLRLNAQGSQLQLPSGQQIAALEVSADLAQAALTMQLEMRDVHGDGELKMSQANLEWLGSWAQHSLLATATLAQGEQTLAEMTVQAQGGLSDPAQSWKALRWQGVVEGLTVTGAQPLRLLTPVPLALSRNAVELGTADVAIAGGNIQFSDTLWTPQSWRSAGHFNDIKVNAVNRQQYQAVLDPFNPLSFDGDWDATVDEHWQGHLTARGVTKAATEAATEDSKAGLQMGIDTIELSLRVEQDQVHAQLEASSKQLGKLALQAKVPLSHVDSGWTILPDAPLAGQLGLQSNNLTWLGPMLDSNLQSGGQLHVDAALIGTFRAPRLQGWARGDELQLALLDQGVNLEQGKLRIRFEPNAVHIDSLAFTAPYAPSPRDKLLADYSLPAGAGQLNASGRIDLQDGSSDLKISAERLPLAQRDDRWIIASGTGTARYANKSLLLDGEIRADAGLINQLVSDRPRLHEDVQIIGVEPASKSEISITVNGSLDLGEHFYIRASGFEGRLAGKLSVRDEPGEAMRVIGIIAAQDAVYYAYGQRLEVERGMVNFQGPLDDPGLNILALRKGLSVEAGVEVTGTVRRPTVRLVSTPNVPDGEKLSWIMLGRVPESSGVDNALLAAAAGSIFSGQSGGEFSQTFGVDEISLTPQAGDDPLQNPKLTLGKQLSTRARISYEQGLSEVGGTAKFIYTLTPRVTIVTRTGIEDAIDIFYSFYFY